MSLRLLVLGLLAAALVLDPGKAQAGERPLIDPKTQERLLRGLRLAQGVSQPFREEAPMTPLQRQRRAYGVVEQAELDAGLTRVLESIRRAAGDNAPPARIHVTPDPSLQAYAAEDGSIFIAAGMLRSMESEDEVAALLAHEYAHVLHGHSGKTLLQKAKDIGAGLTALYLDHEFGADAADAHQPQMRFVRAALLRETAMQAVQSGIVPTRARSQEDEADRVGADLLVAAGYNPVGMVTMLGRLDAWEEQRRIVEAIARRDAERAGEIKLADGVDQVVARSAQNSSLGSRLRGKLGDDDGELVGTLFNSLIRGARRKISEVGQGHRRTSDRIEAVMTHLQSRYGRHRRPDMRPVPWQGNPQVDALFAAVDAVQQLLAEESMGSSKATAGVLDQLQASPMGKAALGRYVMLRHEAPSLSRDRDAAAWYQELSREDSLFASHFLVLSQHTRLPRNAAMTMFETSRKSLGDPPELLPYGIQVYRREGKTETARMYMARCQASADDSLRQVCAKASG